MEGTGDVSRLKAPSLMDLFNRAFSRQEVKCQALPPGRQKGSAGSMQIARDTPHASLETAKKTLTTPGYWDRVIPSAWKSQLTTPFTYSSTLKLRHGAENFVPQGASFCSELLVMADTHRDAREKRPKVK